MAILPSSHVECHIDEGLLGQRRQNFFRVDFCRLIVLLATKSLNHGLGLVRLCLKDESVLTSQLIITVDHDESSSPNQYFSDNDPETSLTRWSSKLACFAADLAWK